MDTGEKKVLFYGAGEYAVMVYRNAVKKLQGFGTPTAFIDGDKYKQGHMLFGLPIISWEKAKELYGEEFYIYVTANHNVAPNIIGFLLENGVAEERILNYEPVEKRLGCGSAETYFEIRPSGDTIGYFACTHSGDNLDYKGIDNRWVAEYSKAIEQEGIEAGIQRIRDMSKKISEGDVEKRHVGCINKRVQYYYKEKKIRNVVCCGNGSCNFRCSYCCLNDEYFQPVKFKQYDIFYEIIKKLEKSKYIDDNTMIHMSNGEFSISSEGKAFMELVENYPVKIFTNAYILSQEAIRALKNTSMIFCSVDAGTRETFKIVKGVDGFQRVSGNLREYAKHGPISLKYILLDGVNDSKEDLDGFFSLADEVATRVNLSRDYMDASQRFSDNALKFAAEFIGHFRKSGILNMHMESFVRAGEKERLLKLMEEV